MKRLTAGAFTLIGSASLIVIGGYGALLTLYSINRCTPLQPGATSITPPNHSATAASGIVQAVGNAPCLLTTGHGLSAALGVILVAVGILIAGGFFLAAGKVRNR